ncbi:DUF599 domain-containing protein [Acidovorax sp. MR-S7]|uniref:DUF599 domain-containing protein n=1 Tax=Acidovorax sp. MR-S7 TaxID=1268622 RepID=UPI0003D3E725|nr:DUF599 domain-containing protein [Acidovorax sp. MR-S7]GAD24573.1 hypothetical protein AVS7_04333 [Acidovorax sp. MR-S7]
MNEELRWLAVFCTAALLISYEVSLALARRRCSVFITRSAYAKLREDWLVAVSNQKGSEILAVQTLRNAVMSATVTASTAALGLMGGLTLSIPTLRTEFGGGAGPQLTPQLAMELTLLALLFFSLVLSVMAVRYFGHAGFIVGMPVGSDARVQWMAMGTAYVRKAGDLYSVGLRQLVLVAPVTAFMLHPMAGPVASVLVCTVLFGFDRVHDEGPSQGS